MSDAGSWDLSPPGSGRRPQRQARHRPSRSRPVLGLDQQRGNRRSWLFDLLLPTSHRTDGPGPGQLGQAGGAGLRHRGAAVPAGWDRGGSASGKLIDRIITVGGLSATVIPEFVSGIVLILVFAVFLGWLPGTATAPEGSSVFTQVRYLILPSICLVLVLFGYIARITRAGVIEALEADYTRTAILKGLPRSKVIRRDVLRNALLPTIAVVATQVGYLIGGLVVVEVLFSYQGIGRLLYDAAQNADFPLLAGGVLVVGGIFQVSMLLADLAYSWLNPRLRLGGNGLTSTAHGPVSSLEGVATIGHVLGGGVDHPHVGLLCDLWRRRHPLQPAGNPDRRPQPAEAAFGRALVRHRRVGPRCPVEGDRRSPPGPDGGAGRHRVGDGFRDLPSACWSATWEASSTTSSAAFSMPSSRSPW